MRRIFVTIAALLSMGSAYAGDVNVGVSISGAVAPGVYGRVDIGNSRPVLVYQQPVVVMRQPRPVRPVYMHVPPGHAKNWNKHCRRYEACGVPVYFVKSAEYSPRRQHRDRHDFHRDDRRHHHGDRRHDHGRRDDHGHGRGHGHGHGRD